MADYRKVKHPLTGAIDNQVQYTKALPTSVFIPFDEGNADYQIYKEWVAEGNTPDEAAD